MRAVHVTRFGIEHLRVEYVPDPIPGSGEVLIATEAATINPADLRIVTGAAAPRIPPGAVAPYTPGWDLAGRVLSCGDGVDRALAGSRVVGFTIWFVTGRGTQASLVTLPTSNVVVAPDGLPSTQLTTVGLNGLTAWRGLADLNLASDETLVITGATGGVGGFAVELAAARGLTVIAVVHERDREEALALGASVAVAVEERNLAATVHRVAPAGADAMLDTASLAADALGALRDGGRYVTVTDVPKSERGISVSRAFGRMDEEGLTTLVEMASSSRLHTPVAKVFEVADARQAYENFSRCRGRGRTVLSFPDSHRRAPSQAFGLGLSPGRCGRSCRRGCGAGPPAGTPAWGTCIRPAARGHGR
jgi:NADPH:quinone reductase